MSTQSNSSLIKPWSVWRHHNGAFYGVVSISNETGERVGYPQSVVYFNLENFKVYTRLANDWHRSMTLEETFWVGTVVQQAFFDSLGEYAR